MSNLNSILCEYRNVSIWTKSPLFKYSILGHSIAHRTQYSGTPQMSTLSAVQPHRAVYKSTSELGTPLNTGHCLQSQPHRAVYKSTSELGTPLNTGHCLQSQPHRAVYKSTSELGTPLHTGQPAGIHYREVPLYTCVPVKDCLSSQNAKCIACTLVLTAPCLHSLQVDPPNDPWLLPHSCGEVCRKALSCGHLCSLLCHPGELVQLATYSKVVLGVGVDRLRL